MKDSKMILGIQQKSTILFFSLFAAIGIISFSGCGSPENRSIAYPENLTVTDTPTAPIRTMGTTNNIDLTERWRYHTGPATSFYSTPPNFPVVVGGKVIISSGAGIEHGDFDGTSHLVALSVESGQVLWQTRLEDPRWGTNIDSVHVDNERLYLVYSYRVHAFSLNTGELLWDTPELASHTSYWFQPWESTDPLLLHSSSQELFTIDPQSGAIKSKQPDDPAWFRIGQVEFVPAHNGLFVYEQPGQRLLWYQLETQPSYRQLQRWPSIVGDDIVFESGAPCYNITRLNIKTGNVMWETPESDLLLSNFAIHNSEVYALREDLSLIALDINTGSIMGTLQFNGPPARTVCRKSGSDVYWVVAEDNIIFVYFGDSQELIALKKTGP